MWRTVGFLMSIAAVIEFAAIVAFAIVLLGGVQKRVQGWRMVVGLLAVIALCQCAAMAIVVRLVWERGLTDWTHVLICSTGLPLRSR